MSTRWSPAARRRLLEQLPRAEHRELRTKLGDASHFALGFLGVKLRPYQRQAVDAIVRSVLDRDGRSFVLLFARQSGKDELLANLILYLMARFAEAGISIVCAQPTFRPQTVTAMLRIQERAGQRPFFALGGFRRMHGFLYKFLSARVAYLSADPSASVVGATADRLLIINEAQDVQTDIYDRRFAPMAASGNATRVFSGTAWTGDTLLDRERRLAAWQEQEDGVRRVFVVDGEQVARSNRHYARFLKQEIAKMGRGHPLIRTQYFCENVDAQSRMFTPAHRALMQPDPEFSRSPNANGRMPVAFLLDVAGQEETSMSSAALPSSGTVFDPHSNPARDAVTLRIIQVDLSTLSTLHAPTYRAVHLQQWTGQNHITVFAQLKALAESWHPQHIVIDATGVGEGLWAMLDRAFPMRVIPVKFTQSLKSELGYGFLAIVNTGRFRDQCLVEGVAEESLAHQSQNASAFFPSRLQIDREYAACESEILIGPQKIMRWGVPDGRRDQDGRPIHDDIPVTDSLTAILDRLRWSVSSPSLIVPPRDPLEEIDRTYHRMGG